MKKILTIFFIILVSIIALNYLQIKNQTIEKKSLAIINNHVFKLDVATTGDEKRIGLAKYKTLPQDMAMLFIFEKPDYYSFWMKDMRFPIDIIFIKSNKIVQIFKNVQQPKSDNENLPIIKPSQISDTVLEINANLSDKYNLKPGQEIEIKP